MTQRAPRVLYVLNGPNLNLLGRREAEHYGRITLAELDQRCRLRAESHGFAAECRQSNHEGDLVDWIQEASGKGAGVVLNAGGYTHASVALLDAIYACERPVVEVHLSNIHAREPFRRVSRIAAAVAGSIAGLGPDGYLFAIDALVRRATEFEVSP